jgi:hypothetical protein
MAASPTQIDQAVGGYNNDATWHLAFQLMTKWVEEGIAPPPDTVVSITPGKIVFPPTAHERKGIQPTVSNLTVSGTLKVNTPVYFNGVAESPIANIAKYEWDFDSNNSYDYAVTSLSSNCGVGPLTLAKAVKIPATHVYTAPGTYWATVRVTDDTVNPPGFISGIQNLGHVVVIVVP